MPMQLTRFILIICLVKLKWNIRILGLEDNMTDLFKENSQRILIYMSTEQQIDPFSKEVESTTLNALPIDALISDLTGSSMSWRTNGLVQEDGKELIIEAKFRSLIELSYKIEIDGKDYQGFKINGAISIKRIGTDYIRVYVYLNK